MGNQNYMNDLQFIQSTCTHLIPYTTVILKTRLGILPRLYMEAKKPPCYPDWPSPELLCFPQNIF